LGRAMPADAACVAAVGKKRPARAVRPPPLPPRTLRGLGSVLNASTTSPFFTLKHCTTPDRSPTATFCVLFSPGGSTCGAVICVCTPTQVMARPTAQPSHHHRSAQHMPPRLTTSVPLAAAVVCNRSMRCSCSSMASVVEACHCCEGHAGRWCAAAGQQACAAQTGAFASNLTF
jgi:hypothetical protein